MSGSNSRRRRLPAVGVTTVGLAVSAGGIAYQQAAAEPIKEPLVTAPISQPKEEVPAWAPPADKTPVTPAGGVTVPSIELPRLPATPSIPTPPVLPAGPTIPPPVIPGAVAPTPEVAPAPRSAVSPQVPDIIPSAPSIQSLHPAPPVIPTPAENRLRSADPGFTVNPVGPAPAVPPPELPTPRLPVLATPTAAAPETSTTTPGDAPMPIPTRQLVMSAVLGTALAANPAFGQDKEAPKPATSFTEVNEQLNDIRKDVKALREFRDNINDALFGKADGKAGADQGLIKRLNSLDELISKINKRLDSIDEKLGGMKTTSGYTPPGTMAPAVTNRAYVRIVNNYPVEMAMMVNGRSHHVGPGEVKTVEVPAGSFTYELLHAGQLPTTNTLRDGETITLRIK